MDTFFTSYEKHLEESGLREKPRQIYNCDESGFRSDQSRHKVLAPRGAKHVYQQAPGTKEHITVLACFNATGEDIPPFIIYPKCFPGGHYTLGGPPQALYGRSSSGYIDGDLFRKWFQHFIKYAVKERPLLLLFDGHKSHMDPEVLAVALREGVILLCLPPHCTHVLQPLDVAYFGPLKAEFSKVAGDLSHFDHSYMVNKSEFARVFRYPYQRCKDMRYVVEGFKKCGLFPFDPSAIEGSRLMPSRTLPGPNTASTGTSSNVPSISTSSPATTGGPSAPAPVPAAAPVLSLALEEHPLIEGGLIAKDLGHILTVLKYRLDRYRRLPVVATCLTGEEYTRQWQERGEKERAGAEEKERRAALRTQRAQERAAMDETIDAIASAGPPAGTTPDSCITTASASQCATPVGAARVPSCRRRPHAYSPGHTIVGPSTPPLQTPAPPSHRRRFCPPPPRCTPPPMSVTTNTASSGPTASSVSPGHTTIAASSGVPAPCNLNTTTSTVNSTSPQVISTSSKTSAASSRAQKRKRKATPVTSVTPPMAPLSEDTTCCARCGERDPPASSSQECRSEVPWVCCDFCQHWFHCRCVQWDQEVAVELDFYCDLCDNIGMEVEI